MLLILLMSGLEILGVSMFITTFMPHVFALGGTNFFLGSIASSSALISLFWNPIAGSLGDSIGRKNVLIQCLWLNVIGNALTCFVTYLPLLFICRLICAFGSPTGVLLRTIVSDVYKKSEEQSAMLKKMGVLMSVCFMSGALISGFISEMDNGILYSFILMTCFALTNLILAHFLPNNKKSQQSQTNISAIQSGKNELVRAYTNLKGINWPRYWDLFSIKSCIDLCYGIMQNNVGFILNRTFGVTGRYMGYVFILLSASSILTNIVMLKVQQKLYSNDNGYKRILHGSLLLSVTFAGLGLSTTLYGFLASVFVMSIARTVLDSTFTELIVAKSTEHDKGSVMSAFESIFSLADFIAPLFSGFIADNYGAQMPILLCIVPSCIAALIANTQKVKTN